MSTYSRSWPGTCVLVASSVALIASFAFLLRTPDAADSLAPLPDPVVVDAELVAPERAAPVSVEVVLGATRTVTAPNWIGIVTAVSLEPGASVTTGDVIAAIDGVGRVAAYTSTPFYRTLERNARGPDVQALSNLLVRLGFLTSETPVFGNGMTRAVRALAASLGVPDSERIVAFDPAWVVYIPAESMEVAEVRLVEGSPAPPVGEVIAVSSPTIEQAHVSPISGYSTDVGVASVATAGHTYVVDDGNALDLSDPVAALALVEAVASPDQADNTGAASRAHTLEGIASLRFPSGLVAVPASAVVMLPGMSEHCVVLAQGSQYVPKLVAVLGSEASTSQTFVGGLEPGAQVVAAPIAASLRDRCSDLAG